MAPNRTHFLVVKEPETASGEAKMQVVVNWFEELRQKAPRRQLPCLPSVEVKVRYQASLLKTKDSVDVTVLLKLFDELRRRVPPANSVTRP